MEQNISSSKHLIVLILLLALIVPMHFVLWTFFPPEGSVFNSYDNSHAILYAVTTSVKKNFQSMWVLDNEPVPKSIFLNPNNGHIYTFIPIGLISLITGLSIIPIYVFLLFLSGILLLLSSYYLIGLLVKNKKEQEMCFIVFSLSAGLGIFFQIPNLISNGVTNLSFVGMGTNIYRTVGLYPSIALIPAIISIILIIKQKIVYSSIFLAISGILLPYVAPIAFIVNILYMWVSYRNRIKNTIKMVIIPALASLVWIIPYVQNNYFFTYYYKLNLSINHVFLPSIFLGLGLTFLFLFYELYNKTTSKSLKSWKIIIIYIFIIAIFSIAELFDPYILSTERTLILLLQNYSLLWFKDIVTSNLLILELPFILLLAFLLIICIKNFDSEKDKKYAFVIIWFFLISLLFFIPSRYTGLLSNRLFFFLYIPASIIATKGIIRFSKQFKKYGLSYKKIIAIIVIFSLPSIIFYNIFSQLAPREHYIRSPYESFEFYSTSEYKALQFLKSQPDGVALAPLYISFYLPFHSEKTPLLSGESPVVEGIISYNQKGKLADYSKFYSTTVTQIEQLEILKKYKMMYIIFTRYEEQVLGANIERLPFLKNIYSSEDMKIYRFAG